jgi:hypothetical protein
VPAWPKSRPFWAHLGLGGPADLSAAARLHGGGEGVMAMTVVMAIQPACSSVATGASQACPGPTGPVRAWFDPNAASGQLPRCRWR